MKLQKGNCKRGGCKSRQEHARLNPEHLPTGEVSFFQDPVEDKPGYETREICFTIL